MNYPELSLPQRQKEEIHRIVSNASDRAGSIDSESILRSLQELVADEADLQTCLADIVIPLLKASIDSPNPEAALNRFSRFAEASFNRRALYQLLRDAPHFIRPVILTFGASTYLSEILIRTPEYFYDIIDPNVMEHQKTSEMMYQELEQSISRFASVEQKLRILRRYKRRETLRIGPVSYTHLTLPTKRIV